MRVHVITLYLGGVENFRAITEEGSMLIEERLEGLVGFVTNNRLGSPCG